jgi:hypothetical protein
MRFRDWEDCYTFGIQRLKAPNMLACLFGLRGWYGAIDRSIVFTNLKSCGLDG